ncbi:MAG: hypothetical protein ACRD8U_17790, partial [Pyrinomonadaceae bacterium]
MPPMNKDQTKNRWWVHDVNLQRTEQRDERWNQVKEFLADWGVVLPSYDPAGALFTVGKSGRVLNNISLYGKDDVDAFDLAFRQILSMLSGKWLPLKTVYGQLVPDKRYFEYNPVSDEVPGETLPFAAVYVAWMLAVVSLGTLTAYAFADRVLGRSVDSSILEIASLLIGHFVFFLGILSMGA